MSKPNVIYILADDMGYGDFGKFNAKVNTPNLNRLIETGCTLSNCYAASPVCAPARAGIMTGKFPQRVGSIDTLEARGLDRIKLGETTMADIFRENGYATGLVGKWHNGAIDPEFHPNNRGFEYFYGFRGGWNDYYDYQLDHNGETVHSDGTYLTDVLSDKAVEYVKAHEETPFFLHLAYNSPHFPFQVPESYLTQYVEMGFHHDTAVIYGMITCMDEGIGRLMNALEETGQLENTIIIFASDNGPDLGHESGIEGMKRYNGDLRGGKKMVYEGGIRVPAVVSWPASLPQNILSDEVVHGTDWLPTLMAMCQLKTEKTLDLDGIDVTAALRGEVMEDRTLCWQWTRYAPAKLVNSAVRQGDMKLVHPPQEPFFSLPKEEVDLDVDMKYHPENHKTLFEGPIPDQGPVADVPVELYNLAEDVSETKDLSAQAPDLVASLEETLETWYQRVEKDRLGNQ